MPDIGKAYVQIVPSAEGISGSISNLLGGEADAAGRSAGSKITGSIKKMIAGAGIGVAFKKALDFGADLQQNLGGTEAVFGKYAETLQSTAQKAYTNMGLSASEYMATANKMGSLFQGSGVSQVKSLEMTSEAMQRAADVASVMGIDMSVAMESIAGAAKSNFTMMDNLGVAMNATTLKAYALEKGINFDWNTASNAEKAELAMKMFMDRTSQYAGNFARESQETLSGSFGAMKAAAQDLLANLTLGGDVGPAMQNLVTTAVGALSNLIPAVGNILKGLPGAIRVGLTTLGPVLLDGFTKATDSIRQNLPTMLKGALQGLMNLSSMLKDNAGDFIDAGLEMVSSIADGIISSIPMVIETVPVLINNFAEFIKANAPKILSTGLSIIKAVAKGLIQAIPVLIKNIPKILKAMWNVFTAFPWANLGKAVLKSLALGIRGAVSTVVSVFKSLVSKAKSTIVSGFEAVKGKVTSIWNAIKDAISRPIEKAVGLVKSAVGRIKSALSAHLSLPHIKLPHFSISGKFSLNPPSIPKIGVSWYKKAEDMPYLFKNATLFGAGEHKDEVLYGKTALMRDIRKATEGNDGRRVTINNYITVSEREDAEGFADRFTRRLELNMRSI
jgi:hypothetical protein